jgi:hypothetical protein
VNVAPRPGGVDYAELTVIAPVVGAGQPLDDLAGGAALAEQAEPVRPVAGVGVGLCRNGADLRLGPGDDRADGQELRLDRDAPLPCVQVAGDDRVRRDAWTSHTSAR